ncbi:hypothetical protein Ptr902_13906 [Pyrenophora tritici-repentis]|nr:hypothetical protein Ptr902_13906 [Pyrenophora tritici-repentis]
MDSWGDEDSNEKRKADLANEPKVATYADILGTSDWWSSLREHPSIKKTSAASSLGTDPPFCIPHLTDCTVEALREVDKVKLFWIAFIPSVVVALFVFFASIRHRRHRASKILDDDAEDILESNTELDDLQPNAFLAPRPSIPMDTIAEASPRPAAMRRNLYHREQGA